MFVCPPAGILSDCVVEIGGHFIIKASIGSAGGSVAFKNPSITKCCLFLLNQHTKSNKDVPFQVPSRRARDRPYWRCPLRCKYLNEDHIVFNSELINQVIIVSTYAEMAPSSALQLGEYQHQFEL